MASSWDLVVGLMIGAGSFLAACGDSSPSAASPVSDHHVDAGADVGSRNDAPAVLPDAADGSTEREGAVAPSDAADADAATLDVEAPDHGADGVLVDASPDAVSQFCGDGIRDFVTEECDDGPGTEDDSCTSDCRVSSSRVAGEGIDGTRARVLGAGRHVVSAGGSGFGVVYTQAGASPSVLLQAFDSWGRRDGAAIDVAAGAQPTGAANPVVAALPGRSYAVAWTDGGGGTPDVALRLVAVGSTPRGAPTLAHGSRSGPQQDPDLIWTGSELVVAWSDLLTVRYRRFDQSLGPLDVEHTLSGATELAGNVSLVQFGNGWAAAWRAGDGGLETVAVRAGDATWSTAPSLPAFEGDHPALAPLDPDHLLVFFTTGGEASDSSRPGGRRLRLAVVDVKARGVVSSNEFVPSTVPYDHDDTLRQRRPAAARIGDRIFVAWETESPLGDPLGAEFWVAEVGWSASEPGVVRKLAEWSAPADANRTGDQKSPALAASPSLPGGALITVWEDHHGVRPNPPGPQLFLNFRPIPFVHLGDKGA